MIKNNIVYDISDLTLNQKRVLIQVAHSFSSNWFAEKLDCVLSFARQSIEMTFDDLLRDFNESSELYVFKRYDTILQDYKNEISFVNTINGINYFFWSYLNDNDFKYIIDGYNLSVIHS